MTFLGQLESKMSYFKIGSFAFLGGVLLFLFIQNKYYRSSIVKKDKDISSLQLSLQAHEQLRKAEFENAQKHKILIQEFKSWSEQKVPLGITEILDF